MVFRLSYVCKGGMLMPKRIMKFHVHLKVVEGDGELSLLKNVSGFSMMGVARRATKFVKEHNHWVLCRVPVSDSLQVWLLRYPYTGELVPLDKTLQKV